MRKNSVLQLSVIFGTEKQFLCFFAGHSSGGGTGMLNIASQIFKKSCEESQQALVELIVLETLCLERIHETSLTKVITMKTKIILAAAFVMTAFSFLSTVPAQAGVFAKLDGIAAETLWMELLLSDPDQSSNYTEVECVYMTLRGLGFDEDEAIMGLVLMSEGFTLDETIRCLTTEERIAIPAFIRTPSEKIAIPAF
ncbi:MAG: hypothetical protein ACR2N1_05040 [Rubripirellula sp.]